jgi:hypothetical protein
MTRYFASVCFRVVWRRGANSETERHRSFDVKKEAENQTAVQDLKRAHMSSSHGKDDLVNDARSRFQLRDGRV